MWASRARSLGTNRPEPGSGYGRRPVSLGEFDIIYFGTDWFAENRTSSHHVAERLARRARVLYVDSLVLRAPKVNGGDRRRLWRHLSALAHRPQCVGDQLWQMSIPEIPFRRLPVIRRMNTELGRRLLRRALKLLGFSRTVSWFAVPHPGCLAKAFGEQAVVYYCSDDHAALPDVDGRVMSEMDAYLTKRADQVFVAASLMLENKRRLNPTTVLAPHGVDVALFRTAADPLLPIDPAARNLTRPVIGFYGLIDESIDLDLIATLAERRPRWTFLLVGRLAVDAGKLKDLPNVVFTGPQPRRSLPGWAKAFDVAIIPGRTTGQIASSGPLKLREYLATGKPVVAVTAPDIQRLARLVRLASGPEEFIGQIEAALDTDTGADRLRRIAATVTMSWDARVNEVIEIVEHRIQLKSRNRPDS